MKRALRTGAWLLGGLCPLGAGGVFYNSNQSAEYLRSFDRNSAIDNADIVYYNMAGTVRLREGLSFNVSNQTIFQQASVATRGNPVLGDRVYRSNNPAWVVPNLYGAYRRGRLALFTGLETLGATATRTWPDGLPTLDLQGRQQAGYGGAASAIMAGDAYGAALRAGQDLAQARAAALGAGLDSSSFQAHSRLQGSSLYLAWRWGAAYRLRPKLALALAGRCVLARQEILGQVDASSSYDRNGHDFRGQSRLLMHRTDLATGFSGELGLNLYPSDNLVLSFTLEMPTPLSFKTSVRDGQDGGGLFQDGQRARLDLPMALRLGLGWQASPRLRASVGLNAYLEKRAHFGLLAFPRNGNDPGRDYRDTVEESCALEYRLNPAWLLSAGVNFNQIGQARSATLDTSLPGAHANYLSLGAGFQVQASERLRFNLGLGHTRFQRAYEHADLIGDERLRAAFAAQGEAIDPRKAYDKRYFILAFGLDYHFSW